MRLHNPTAVSVHLLFCFFFNENLKVETFNGLNHGRNKVHNVCFFKSNCRKKPNNRLRGSLFTRCIIRKPCACSDPGFL